MPRQDDPTIFGDLILLRRVPPVGGRVTWDENGKPIPSSMNFKDKDHELSVYISRETTVEDVLNGHDGFGVIQFTAQQVRDEAARYGIQIVMCRDDLDPANGHVLVCGKISGGMAKRLSDSATWVEGRWPTRQQT